METLRLKKGTSYVLRNGLLTGELQACTTGGNYRFEATVEEPQHDTPTVACWLASGRFLTNEVEHRLDIISEHNQQ